MVHSRLVANTSFSLPRVVGSDVSLHDSLCHGATSISLHCADLSYEVRDLTWRNLAHL